MSTRWNSELITTLLRAGLTPLPTMHPWKHRGFPMAPVKRGGFDLVPLREQASPAVYRQTRGRNGRRDEEKHRNQGGDRAEETARKRKSSGDGT
ncbi:unnamed protein product [Lota lota]